MSILGDLYKNLIKLGVEPDAVEELLSKTNVYIQDSDLQTGDDVDSPRWLQTTGNGGEVELIIPLASGVLTSTVYNKDAQDGLLLCTKYQV